MSIATEIERIKSAKESIINTLKANDVAISETATIDELDVTMKEVPILDTSDATATETDILINKTAYVNGKKITGTFSGGSGTHNTTMANPNNRTSFGLTYWMSEMNEVDMKGVTTASNAFQNCANLKKINIKNMGSVKTAYQMFQGCISLTEIPELNLSSATNIYSMFQNTGFVEVDGFEALKATDPHSIFSSCKSLVKVGDINLPVATETQTMFSSCIALTEVGNIYIPNGKQCQQLFNSCSKLVTIGEIDMSSATNVSNMFGNCSVLKNIGGFINLGKGFVTQANNSTYYKLSMSDSSSITHDSLMNIINGLYDLNLTYDVANGGTLYTQTINIGNTNKGRLSAEEIAIATAKGWTIS